MRMQYNLVVEMRAFLNKQGSAKSENDPNLNYRGSQLCFFLFLIPLLFLFHHTLLDHSHSKNLKKSRFYWNFITPCLVSPGWFVHKLEFCYEHQKCCLFITTKIISTCFQRTKIIWFLNQKKFTWGNEKLHGVPPILLPNLFYSECINRKREEKIYFRVHHKV